MVHKPNENLNAIIQYFYAEYPFEVEAWIFVHKSHISTKSINRRSAESPVQISFLTILQNQPL
jgi:hypothetical protein